MLFNPFRPISSILLYIFFYVCYGPKRHTLKGFCPKTLLDREKPKKWSVQKIGQQAWKGVEVFEKISIQSLSPFSMVGVESANQVRSLQRESRGHLVNNIENINKRDYSHSSWPRVDYQFLAKCYSLSGLPSNLLDGWLSGDILVLNDFFSDLTIGFC